MRITKLTWVSEIKLQIPRPMMTRRSSCFWKTICKKTRLLIPIRYLNPFLTKSWYLTSQQIRHLSLLIMILRVLILTETSRTKVMTKSVKEVSSLFPNTLPNHAHQSTKIKRSWSRASSTPNIKRSMTVLPEEGLTFQITYRNWA